jgi:hypothetical protein
MANPLRIAEEAATLTTSQGPTDLRRRAQRHRRFEVEYGHRARTARIGSEIIRRAWREDNFSTRQFYDIQALRWCAAGATTDAEIHRAVSVETFPAAGNAAKTYFLSVQHEDVRMFKQHIDVAKPDRRRTSGDAPVYLRCPGFVAKPMQRPQEARADADAAFPEPKRLLGNLRRQNSPAGPSALENPAASTEITLRKLLRGSVFIGSPDAVVGS